MGPFRFSAPWITILRRGRLTRSPFRAADRRAEGPAPLPRASHEAVLAGVDVLAAENFARLRGKRVGLLTNQTGRSRDGESTIDVLARAPGVTLAALFSPEHGIRGEVDVRASSSRDEK